MKRKWLVLTGILLVALNLRPAVTSVPPVLGTIRGDLSLSYTAVSLLTTIPTFCIGVFAFASPRLSQRLGRERAILVAVVLIGVATVLRLGGMSVAVLFGSTVLVGIGIGISQSLLPSMVNEFFSGREAFVTGLYTSSLSIGAAVAAGGTAFLASRLNSWPMALAFWAVLSLAAIATWLLLARDGEHTTSAETVADTALPWRDYGAWILTAFFAGHTLLYYSELTWIAPAYDDLGWGTEQVGLLLTVYVIAQLGGTLSVSALADRSRDRRPWIALTVVMNAVALAGIVWMPFLSPWGWAVLAGAGLGAMFALGLTLPADLAPDENAADRLSAIMIGVSYLVASIGPFGIGWMRSYFGSFNPPFVALIALSAGMLVTVVWFRPGRRIDA